MLSDQLCMNLLDAGRRCWCWFETVEAKVKPEVVVRCWERKEAEKVCNENAETVHVWIEWMWPTDTDGWTDIIVTIAVLVYIASPKTNQLIKEFLDVAPR